jgi:very-short-patch-repair endonuclease
MQNAAPIRKIPDKNTQRARTLRRDEARTRAIEKLGYRVIRFWNNDVLANPEGVLTMILEELQRQPKA